MRGDDIAIKVSNLSKRYQIYNQPNDRLKQFIVPQIAPKKQMLCENIERKYQAPTINNQSGGLNATKLPSHLRSRPFNLAD